MELDWYDAVVIDNEILGNAFPVADTCVFRRCTKDGKRFEIFNLKDTVVVVSGEEAKKQLRSARDRNNAVVRAKDQGYVNWKYSTITINV
jgi:hypothetical protein